MGNTAETPVCFVSVCCDVCLWFEPVCSLTHEALYPARHATSIFS